MTSESASALRAAGALWVMVVLTAVRIAHDSAMGSKSVGTAAVDDLLLVEEYHYLDIKITILELSRRGGAQTASATRATVQF